MARLIFSSKGGQAHMMETIGALFIFFILIVFAMMFYYNYQEVSLQEKSRELVASRAMHTTLISLFLPELQCSRGNSEAEDNCIDLMKLRSLNKTFNKYSNEYYFNMFGYSNIYVQMVHPGNKTWTIYEREKLTTDSDGNTTIAWTFKEPTYFVVTLKDEVHGVIDGNSTRNNNLGVYSFGYLVVEVFS